jgi:hypothetical protein
VARRSAFEIAQPALTKAKWLKACGKLKSISPVAGSTSPGRQAAFALPTVGPIGGVEQVREGDRVLLPINRARILGSEGAHGR